MKMFCKFFSTLVLYFSLCLALWAAKPVDVLFCAYDTGDSNAISRILPRLKEENLTYSILAFGRGTDIFKDEKAFYKIKGGSLEDRAQLLPQSQIEDIQEQFQPKIVFSGMASVGQAQVLNAFPGSKRVAFYDNFDAPEGKEFIQPFIGHIGQINLYMVPAQFLVPNFQRIFNGIKVRAVGQPALEEWKDVFENTDRDQLKKDLKLETDQKVILFAGGVEKTYPHYLKIFVSVVARHPEWKIFITYHPKTDGEAEREAVKEFRASNTVVGNEFKTNILATIADQLVCHKSSVCQQAFSVGVSCSYVAGDDYHNFLIDQKLVDRLDTEADLEAYLVEKIKEQSTPWKRRLTEHQAILSKAGIPSDASPQIVGQLKELIRE